MHFLEGDYHYTKLFFVPKTKYTTLGPKSFCCNRLAITRRIKQKSAKTHKKLIDFEGFTQDGHQIRNLRKISDWNQCTKIDFRLIFDCFMLIWHLDSLAIWSWHYGVPWHYSVSWHYWLLRAMSLWRVGVSWHYGNVRDPSGSRLFPVTMLTLAASSFRFRYDAVLVSVFGFLFRVSYLGWNPSSGSLFGFFIQVPYSGSLFGFLSWVP